MSINRSIKETTEHRHPVLPNAERFRVQKCTVSADFTPAGEATIWLTVTNKDTEEIVCLKFGNVNFEEPVFQAMRDATGLYVMDTRHLGWAANQRIEVGDWDDGTPVFWAENVQLIENQ